MLKRQTETFTIFNKPERTTINYKTQKKGPWKLSQCFSFASFIKIIIKKFREAEATSKTEGAMKNFQTTHSKVKT